MPCGSECPVVEPTPIISWPVILPSSCQPHAMGSSGECAQRHSRLKRARILLPRDHATPERGASERAQVPIAHSCIASSRAAFTDRSALSPLMFFHGEKRRKVPRGRGALGREGIRDLGIPSTKKRHEGTRLGHGSSSSHCHDEERTVSEEGAEQCGGSSASNCLRMASSSPLMNCVAS